MQDHYYPNENDFIEEESAKFNESIEKTKNHNEKSKKEIFDKNRVFRIFYTLIIILTVTALLMMIEIAKRIITQYKSFKNNSITKDNEMKGDTK